MICAECEKECEHDQYHCWCNDCGKKIENEMIERLSKEVNEG